MRAVRSPRFPVLLSLAGAQLLVLAVAAVALWLHAEPASPWSLRLLAAAVLVLGVAFLLAMTVVLELESRARARADEAQRVAQKAVERAQSESKRALAEIERLGHLGDQLRPCRSVEDIGEVLGATMKSVLPQHHGALYLQTPSRNVVRRQIAFGKAAVNLEEMFTPDDCWAMRRQALYPNAPDAPPCHHLSANVDVANTCCVPLLAQGELLGILHFEGDIPLTTVESRVAQNLADLLAQAVANLRLQDAMRVQSVRDPLTSLFNRRYLDAALLRECLRARRNQQQFGVLLLDLDDFKRFNDQHGHAVGDAALTQTGGVINQNVRNEDIACRYGGEEFVVIMPNTDGGGALDRAEMLRRAIHAAPLELHGRRLQALSVSVGISIFPEHGHDPGVLIESAHRAMASAKQNGRDRSEVAALIPPKG